jgi:HAD superfamily hydrolase (TIGR01509 family)
MNLRISSVIFDLGGVILRTVNPEPREILAEKFGVSRKELESFIFMSETSIQSEVGKLSDKEHWEVILRHFGQPIENYLDTYHEFFSGDAIDQELITYIGSLKPTYKIALLSNAWVNAREQLGRKYDFLDKFNAAIFSYEVGKRKPDRAIFMNILEQLDEKGENTIFIDDMLVNVEGARKAGLNSVHFKDTPSLIEYLNTILN